MPRNLGVHIQHSSFTIRRVFFPKLQTAYSRRSALLPSRAIEIVKTTIGHGYRLLDRLPYSATQRIENELDTPKPIAMANKTQPSINVTLV